MTQKKKVKKNREYTFYSICPFCQFKNFFGEIMFFSAERDNGGILETGRNSTSKEALRKELAELLSGENPETNYEDATLFELLACMDCVLLETKGMIQRENYEIEADCN